MEPNLPGFFFSILSKESINDINNNLAALRKAGKNRVRTYCLTVVAALQISGGHWTLLQSVAWVGMVVSYTPAGRLVGRCRGEDV